ncbi:MAG: pyridoxamine 5'-phosphate oxidase [Pelagibacteraceae bacterium]|nr:pyridoxamine 5'-phosphate oxidase [Pelagibacteraceae bacterium]|tara:strand:- start:15 stop:605 length:591 start_codon:yes stop_codon:yes gene_type:complete
MLDKNKDPLSLFKEWFDLAKKNEVNDPNAMNLATVDTKYKPHSRMVLLKDFSNRGFVFYTNLNSNKGVQFKENPNVALNFHWKSLQRQIRIEGTISQVEDNIADDYYNSRGYLSRIGAWASKQSSLLNSREELEKLIQEFKIKYPDEDNVPRPNFWTGLVVLPNLIEFWQDMPHRIHDRLVFERKENGWVSRKLFP